MVQTCCVKNCKGRQKRSTNISFHQFPKNPELRQQWIKAIHNDNFEPLPHLRVCSKHFTSDCFVESPWSSKRMLRANAIPNLLDVPETQYMQETDVVLDVLRIETEHKTASTKNKFESDSLIDTAITDEENVSFEKSLKKKRKAYIGDFEECDVTNEKENYLLIINTTIAKKNKQIKTLQQRNRRLKQKIKDLRLLVDDLKSKHMIIEDVP